ncbi:MAG TPA: aminoacyl-tRNA hydrolase [Candidatus Binataceae bacterium]|nr:aminoacyl-tRNA hydrolase [Candidatus Binataceae bacterium]
MSRLGRLFGKFRQAPHPESGEPAAEQPQIRWVIVGLGNPGEQYARSRHNLGFMTARRLAARHSIELDRRKWGGLCGEIRGEDATAIVVTPQTYYNRSGDCASAILGYYKVPPDRLIVIHDEMDLPEGQIRLKRGGGDAGNRGVRSIAEALATPEFIRLRIGVAHPCGDRESVEYLLKPLSAEQMRGFEPVCDRAADAALSIMRDGLDRARNLFNQRV